MRAWKWMIVLCAAWRLAGLAHAEDAAAGGGDEFAGKAGRDFVVGISPFLDTTVKDTVYRGLMRLIVEDLPLGSRLEVFDAYNLRSVARVEIPAAKVFSSAKTRANQFAPAIGEIREFLAHENARPKGLKAGEGCGATIRLPEFCDFLARNRPANEAETKWPLLLIGSPLYQDAKEPDFSMADGYFPSDGHLRASRADSVFGFNPGDELAQRWLVDWVYFGDPWQSDLHREKVQRFWALYMERRGGRLASFSGDMETALSAFATEAAGRSAAANGWTADAQETKPEMLRVSRDVRLVDWLTGDSGLESNMRPPSKLVAPMKIGIRWKDNIDLDLYATPKPGAETLFFQHTRSPEGYYNLDHRSSPGHDYEYIEFEAPVDAREVKAFVNFYAGSRPDGPRGEVRIEFLNRIYRGKFAIEAKDGNQGRSGPSQDQWWTEIPIQKILGIAGMAEQAANGTK